MGPIGYPEMVFIFILALLLFGPKKLPELGKMLGKGLTEFNRAKNELKSTFDREMRDLERETQSIKEVTNTHFQDTYNYDYSYDAGHHGPELANTPALEPSTLSASATEGAELTYVTTEAAPAIEGTIANQHFLSGPVTDFPAMNHSGIERSEIDHPAIEATHSGETAEHTVKS